jgi:hypothetical protein
MSEQIRQFGQADIIRLNDEDAATELVGKGGDRVYPGTASTALWSLGFLPCRAGLS